MSNSGLTVFESDRPEYALPGARYMRQPLEAHRLWKGQKNVRFPWSHKSEPLDFHSVKTLPWKNHSAVCLRWAPQAMLWLVEGSGGESHLRRSSRN